MEELPCVFSFSAGSLKDGLTEKIVCEALREDNRSQLRFHTVDAGIQIIFAAIPQTAGEDRKRIIKVVLKEASDVVYNAENATEEEIKYYW